MTDYHKNMEDVLVYCVVMCAVLIFCGVFMCTAGLVQIGGTLCLISTALLVFGICVGLNME